MRSRVLWVCCVMLCLASLVGRASVQNQAAPTTADDENLAVQVEAATVEGDEAEPVQFFPIPEGTVFIRHTVLGEGADQADVTAVADEQLVYSNTLGKIGAALGTGNLVADDITTIIPGDCKLRRFTFPVLGKVNPAGISGPYTINFALYSSCPGSLPIGSVPTLIIPGTQGQASITNQCQNATDDDGDGFVNDGCPAVGPPETGAQCLNAIDDDGDGFVNDGCPAVGPAETDADVPRMITFVAGSDVPLPTNLWFGVKFSRNNAGVIIGTPPMKGFSCDQYDYPGSPCTAWAGGFPTQPQASFNLEIYADSACSNSFTGYKNDNPSGPTFNPGADVVFADDIELITAPPPTPPPSTICNMIAYEVAVKGESFYTFDLRRNCDSSVIAGTERNFTVFGTTEARTARFTFDPPIPLPQNMFLSAKISAPSGGVVVSGQQACIGRSDDSFQVASPTGCNPTVYPPPPSTLRSYAAFSASITCAGAAPVGACCDMYIPDANGEAVCRQVPEVNCPFPPRFLGLRPEWVQAAVCSPDPFSPQPCGKAACCKPDGTCENLTLNECNAAAPLTSPRQWQLGRYCNSEGQRCPRIPCLARTGECTLPRCVCPCGEACLFPPPCSVGPACCDSCPPVGCEDADCCTDVCNNDTFCCDTEWDDTCAASARTLCNVRPGNDVCIPAGRLEGARLMTTGPPGNTAESDSGRATTDPGDPGFGCYLDNHGAKGLQTVWYKFVATHTTALLQTCNSNSPANDSLLSVYAVGDPSTPTTQCNTLIPVGCSDDVAGCSSSGKNAKVCVRNLIVGNLYYVLVASKIALLPGKAYRLDIVSPCTSPYEGSPNNYCPGATSISNGNTAFSLANTPPVTPETLDAPKLTCIPFMDVDEWYNYTATCTGQLTVDTCGNTPGVGPDTNLAIYDGNVCPQLTGSAAPIACSDDYGSNCGTGGQGSKIVIDAVQGNIYKIRLADSLGNLASGNLKIGCVQAPCPAGVMTFTNPPDGVVDAGRPHDPNNAASLQGIQTITATGPHDAQASCFTLCETAIPPPPNASPNSVANVVQNPPGTYTITLARPITGGALTTITYTDTHGLKSTGRFSSAPANVNADIFARSNAPSDLDFLLDALNGVAVLPWGIYSSDINRSNLFTPADLLEEIDLLEGNGAYEPWDFTSNPSGSDCIP